MRARAEAVKQASTRRLLDQGTVVTVRTGHIQAWWELWQDRRVSRVPGIRTQLQGALAHATVCARLDISKTQVYARNAPEASSKPRLEMRRVATVDRAHIQRLLVRHQAPRAWSARRESTARMRDEGRTVKSVPEASTQARWEAAPRACVRSVPLGAHHLPVAMRRGTAPICARQAGRAALAHAPSVRLGLTRRRQGKEAVCHAPPTQTPLRAGSRHVGAQLAMRGLKEMQEGHA
jgi:hypothetical protein